MAFCHFHGIAVNNSGLTKNLPVDIRQIFCWKYQNQKEEDIFIEKYVL